MADPNSRKSVLLNEVKAQVKKIMEEAVVRSYVHEENDAITSLCASVEVVLNHGLKSAFLDFLDSNRTLVLCRRISSDCPFAQQVLDRMDFHENAMSWSSNSRANAKDLTNPQAVFRSKMDSVSNVNGFLPTGDRQKPSTDMKSATRSRAKLTRGLSFSFGPRQVTIGAGNPDPRFKHFWIRVALLEKVLDKILLYLTRNASQYYEKYAILADPCDGMLLTDLLRGPCTIDYSRTRTSDHLFTDPPVSELIKRHGMSGSLMSRQLPYITPSIGTQATTTPRSWSIPSLLCSAAPDAPNGKQLTRALHVDCGMAHTSSNGSLARSTDRSSSFGFPVDSVSPLSAPRSSRLRRRRHLVKAAKQHVESMHQSFRPTLVYGKNNVHIPMDKTSTLPGYLSVHDYGNDKGIYINWTPNSAIDKTGTAHWNRNGELASLQSHQRDSVDVSREHYWDYAIRVKARDLVYVHCHENGTTYSAVLVTKEGLPLTPLLFDSKRHRGAFLSSLEQSVIMLGGFFDPPFERDHDANTTPQRKTQAPVSQALPNLRIFGMAWDSNGNPQHLGTPRLFGGSRGSSSRVQRRAKAQSLFVSTTDLENCAPIQSPSSSRESHVYMIGFGYARKRKQLIEKQNELVVSSPPVPIHKPDAHKQSSETLTVLIEDFCSELRRRILAESFKKWLGTSRKMRLLCARLTRIVGPELVTIDHPTDASGGMTVDLWRDLMQAHSPDCTFAEFCRYVYFGSCDPSIRHEVWPYLLGVYRWEADAEDIARVEEMNREKYTSYLNEWKELQAWIPDPEITVGSEKTQCTSSVLQSTDTVECDDSERPKTGNAATRSRQSVVSSTGSFHFNEDAGNENKVANSLSNPLVRVEIDKPACYVTNASTPNPHLANCSISVDLSPVDTAPQTPPYAPEILNSLGLNLYRIDKDVSRCDRNHSFFAIHRNPLEPRCSMQGNSTCDQLELSENLHKLRNVICTWVWLHLDVGYIQGMCDLLAPLLVVLKEESLAFACFSALMEWMLPNFPTARPSSPNSADPRTADATPPDVCSPVSASPPQARPTLLMLSKRLSHVSSGSNFVRSDSASESLSSTAHLDSAVDSFACLPSPYITGSGSHDFSHMNMRFAHLTDLIEIFDPDLRKFLSMKAIDGQFYFCYRWLLLDFKREFNYDGVFAVWETIWAARRLVCYDFGLFLTFAMLQYYRDIILYYDMEMTEIIRFYNEMSEQHNVTALLDLARSLVFQTQTLLQDQ